LLARYWHQTPKHVAITSITTTYPFAGPYYIQLKHINETNKQTNGLTQHFIVDLNIIKWCVQSNRFIDISVLTRQSKKHINISYVLFLTLRIYRVVEVISYELNNCSLIPSRDSNCYLHQCEHSATYQIDTGDPSVTKE